MPNFVELKKDGKTFIVNIDNISFIVTYPSKSEEIKIGTDVKYFEFEESIHIYFKGDSEPLRLTRQSAKPLLDTLKRQFTIHP